MSLEIKIYSLEELEALKEWFNKQDLPQSMQINPASRTENLKNTVDSLFENIFNNRTNPKIQGSLRLLLQIKENIEKEQHRV